MPVPIGRVGGMTLYLAPPTPIDIAPSPVRDDEYDDADESDLIVAVPYCKITGKRCGPLHIPK